MKASHRIMLHMLCGLLAIAANRTFAQEPAALPKAAIDGNGPGWKALAQADFVNVNCDADTWTWKEGVIYCTGKPVGVMRTAKPYTNLDMVVQWRHMKSAGNSGVFLWASESSLSALNPGQLPHG